MNLPHGLSQYSRTKKPTGETSDKSLETKLAVLVRAHEEKVVLDVDSQKLEHAFWGQTNSGKGVGFIGYGVVDRFSQGLEDGWVALRKIIYHDLRIEFLDSKVDEGSCANGRFWVLLDKPFTFFDAWKVLAIHVDPFAAGLPDDTYIV